MLTKSDIPKSLVSGIRTEFMKSYIETSVEWQKVATIIPSTKSEETYAWLGQTPKMREWKDERIPKGLSEYSFTIKNRKWEASLAIDREAIEDEQYGQIMIRAKDLGAEAKRHPEELVFSLLQDGFSTTGATGDIAGKNIAAYDGKSFFATDHTFVGGEYTTNQSNRGTSALASGSLQAVLTAMRKFKDDRGRIAGVVPTDLVVPADLEWTARELLNSAYFPEEGTTTTKLATNVMKGILNLIVSPYLTDTNNWFVLANNRVVKPIIFQMRTPEEFNALEGDSEHAFKTDEYLYGIRSRYNVGFGDWRFAYGSIL